MAITSDARREAFHSSFCASLFLDDTYAEKPLEEMLKIKIKTTQVDLSYWQTGALSPHRECKVMRLGMKNKILYKSRKATMRDSRG